MFRAALLASVPLALLAAPLRAQPTPAAAEAVPGRAAPASVLVRTGQHVGHGRVVLHLPSLPPYTMRKSDDGWELRLTGDYALDLSTIRPLTELSGLAARREGGETVLTLRTNMEAEARSATGSGMLWIDLHPTAPRATAQEAERRRLADRAVNLGLMTREQAEAALRPAARPGPVPVPKPAATPPSGPPVAAEGEAALRSQLLAQIGQMNGAAPAAPARRGASPAAPTRPAAPVRPAAAPAVAPAPAPAAAPARPTCGISPLFPAGWQAASGSVADRLTALRAAFARSQESLAETADLAEFYLAQGLAEEAVALAQSRPTEGLPSPDQARLARAADAARLLLRQPVDADSLLLADRPECEREDLALWQALNAAATGDAARVAALVPRARTALREAPERLRFALAFALADTVEEDVEALRSLLAPLRNARGSEAEMAGRAWLQARIARLENNRDEEMRQLTRAAGAGRTLPALFARARLAGLQAEATGPEAARAEARLVDVLRTYRFEPLGEEAAVMLGGLLVGRGDYAGALEAGESAGSATAHPGVESRGALLIARILRRLMTEEGGSPGVGERLALWWRYEGYATPGERGDDIRMGAARLLLRQGFPGAALDALRQLGPATAASPAGMALLAQAEATAPEGDPQRALALLRDLPASPEARRSTAAALARLDRPAEAARALDGLGGIADRLARAGYLYAARAWPAAAGAYADLLRDPALDAAGRAEATPRFASAAALAGTRPAEPVPDTALAVDATSMQLLRLTAASAPASAPPAGPQAGVAAIRTAIERARDIEALLPPQKDR
ncbi:hypothetical protein [Paracraurococcus lichenis]|uniref:Tetratricopeptide repeat protein n=1 Tax=Paracraurococcus lichenis TaxID=3064888 RepID=A0ABT9EAE9_9PROT|nr:hypothetical protein [Paracraurococcus sp. LOR1-02]MDO9713030.1 hypothetical protein [Paracraurococcus sp. LOR1-02]